MGTRIELPDAEEPTPAPTNPPGSAAIAYRIGTHDVFRRRMLARLRGVAVVAPDDQASRPLAALTTQAADDPAVALIDAWAAAADVLTFYQERIANEGFLRTATERRSVLELARTVGYELHPGLAADTHLAFVVEDAPGAPPAALVPRGTKVQSIPGEGQLPQTFETMDALDARVAWNALSLAVPTRPATNPPTPVAQRLTGDTTELWVDGTDTRLKPGDTLLIRLVQDPGERLHLVSVNAVVIDSAIGRTRVTWDGRALKDQPAVTRPANQKFSLTDPVLVLRQQAGLFGNAALELPERSADVVGSSIDLDSTYLGLVTGGWVVVVASGVRRVFRVMQTSLVGRADFKLSGRVTRLELDTPIVMPQANDLRLTSVFLQSEPLRLSATVPLPPQIDEPAAAEPTTSAGATSLVVDRAVTGLQPGRPLAITGLLAPDDSGDGTELVTLTGTSDREGRTTLHIRPGLQRSYRTRSVRIAANVVRATHGETVADEVLGSGDAQVENQQFILKRGPLTHVSAPTITGSESALEVRVNGVRWREVVSLFQVDSRSRSYIVRRDHAGRSHVVFGDGTAGARLPTGQENIIATYRSGNGIDGNAATDAISLLQTRPLGIRSVTNPRPASGGTAPESTDAARHRAPRTVNTLGRIVSLTDVEALALSLVGLGKAQAALVWNGEARALHLTVASVAGGSLERSSDLYRTMLASFRALGHGRQRVHVDSYTPRFFAVEARLWIAPGLQPARVLDDVTQALRQTFSFERRAFGQGVAASEVIAVIHRVSGVVAVDLDSFRDSQEPHTGTVQPFIPAETAHVVYSLTGAHIEAAELLLIDESGLRLSAAAVSHLDEARA